MFGVQRRRAVIGSHLPGHSVQLRARDDNAAALLGAKEIPPVCRDTLSLLSFTRGTPRAAVFSAAAFCRRDSAGDISACGAYGVSE